MKSKKRLACVILIAGFSLMACRFPTWLASEISEFISPYLPTSTVTLPPSPSDTPEPNPTSTDVPSQTIQVVDRRIFEDSEIPRYEIDGVWPNLEGPEDVVAVYNNESDRLTGEIREDFLMIVEENDLATGGSGEAPLSTLTFYYDLTFSEENIFSIHQIFDQYIAMSVHPFPFSYSLNFDAHKVEFIQLPDLFLPGIDFVEELEAFIDPVLIDRDFGYMAGTAGDIMAERENWNLLPEGLRLNFDVYEVAPYAAGPQYILIPWQDLSSMIDPDGPAGSFIE